MHFADFVMQNRDEMLRLTGEHIFLVTVSIAVAAMIGIPLGIVLTRKASLKQWTLGLVNIIQTIPSLALFGFLIPVPFIGGIGSRTAIVALTLYALLPIVRNTCVGIASVDRSVVEAARAMGMSDAQILWRVEIPLSLSVILAGLRVATVIGVGVATIAAAIGAGGLGQFIFRGVSMVNDSVILAGAVPAAILALIADASWGWLERRFAVQ